MTPTTALWIALVAAVGTTAVRTLHTRRPVRLPTQRPPSEPDEDAWRPHVITGCGR
ncbi:MAG TPA: hypothetical protein VEV65_05845 [Kineosporiaceae bacterium]|nr:hypothetical protein [Kineosporiaceae bacterium]